jgi:tRNA (guanine9-N1)-methyltransferase
MATRDDDDDRDVVQRAESKRAMKKRLKRQRRCDAKLAKRAEAKRRKADVAASTKAAFHAKVNAMSSEARDAFFVERGARIEARRRETAERKERRRAQLSSAYGLVIDCDEDLTTTMERERWGSLMKQLRAAYERNCKTTAPFKMSFTRMSEAFEEQMGRMNAGWENWHVVRLGKTLRETAAESETTAKSLVYLTADSERELREIEAGKTYVIGGFIDRNRHKGLTLRKARELGVEHARLPIGEFLETRGAPVLTVNQTADVLTSFLERGDWGEAIEAVVPARKVVKIATNRSNEIATNRSNEADAKIKDAERARDEDEDEDEDEDASPTADDDDDAPTSTDGAPR